MNGPASAFPFVATLAGVMYLCVQLLPPKADPRGFDLYNFARIPVVDGGRIKPLDSVAHSNLLVISNKQEATTPDGVKVTPIRWLLDVMSSENPAVDLAGQYKVVRIENTEVLSFLDLEHRPGSLRYSLSEILQDPKDNTGKKYDRVQKQIEAAMDKDTAKRTLFDNKILELSRRIKSFSDLNTLHSPLIVPPGKMNLEWESVSNVEKRLQEFSLMDVREQIKIAGFTDPKAIPPEKLNEFIQKSLSRRDQARLSAFPAAAYFRDMLAAYRANRVDDFNQTLKKYQNEIIDKLPVNIVNRAATETFFNDFAPFYHCAILYVLIGVLAALSWLTWTEPLRRAALAICVMTLCVHTMALLGRMYIMDRPLVFVTNLYSSAIFIAWGCVVLGIVLEWIYKNGTGAVMASVTGFLSLLIAHNLAETGSGDTMEMLQAVLDTNFWLATHVTTVTAGYAATFIAGFLGIMFILRGVFTSTLDAASRKQLANMIYGTLCFATLLSFVGTVLGGIWADQSWGRFWGWDPKENGALMIVMWNALILHARWGGMAKDRGIAILAIFGNIVTSWSWFGVNMLGVGLHSYGFMESAVFWMLLFAVSQLIIMTIGLIPEKNWMSNNPPKNSPVPKTRPKQVRATAGV